MGDAYVHWTLPRIVGSSVAADLLLTGRTFDGREAKELGVCSRVLPDEEVLPAALEVARDIADEHGAAIGGLLQAALSGGRGTSTPTRSSGSRPSTTIGSWPGPTPREGVLAFLEHRDPAWRGRLDD